MEAKRLSELLWKLSQKMKQWMEDRAKAGRIIPGRDNDLLSFQIATGDSFVLAYSALLLDHGHAAEAIRKPYDAIKAALQVSQIDDPQQWAEALLSSYGDLVLRCQLLAREFAMAPRQASETAPAEQTDSPQDGGPVTLEQFLRDYCQSKGYGEGRLGTLRTCLFKGNQRGAITLPQHVGTYKRGKAKRFYPEDLVKEWAGYCREFPSLPPLKAGLHECLSGQSGEKSRKSGRSKPST